MVQYKSNFAYFIFEKEALFVYDYRLFDLLLLNLLIYLDSIFINKVNSVIFIIRLILPYCKYIKKYDGFKFKNCCNFNILFLAQHQN